MSIGINNYAPVLIPTLNRYEHFKRCLESLEKCTGAEYTEVYVALDYPPSEKYVTGWKRIDEYLKEKEIHNGFKSLNVTRRERNYGVCHEHANFETLLMDLERKYDRHIDSEDDNEFSPNFLEYMNKALEKYKDAHNVYKVSAYTAQIFKNVTKQNFFWGIDVSAYGLGSWIYKDKAYIYTNKDIAKDLHKSYWKTLKYFFVSPALVNSAVHMIMDSKDYGDIRFSMHNLIKGTFVLQPSVSMSRNWGADGSGVHSGIVKDMEKIEIQTSEHIEIDDIPFNTTRLYIKRLFFYRMPTNFFKFVFFLCYDFLYLMRFMMFDKTHKLD